MAAKPTKIATNDKIIIVLYFIWVKSSYTRPRPGNHFLQTPWIYTNNKLINILTAFHRITSKDCCYKQNNHHKQKIYFFIVCILNEPLLDLSSQFNTLT